MNKSLDSIKIEYKKGTEIFRENDSNLPFALLDFWQWFGSDLINNTTRGFLAEFLVAKALNNTETPRVEWDAYDAETEDGITVEVKSASYIQTWKQKKYSKISFGVAKTKAWDAENNTHSDKKKRQADVYVFCLLNHNNQETLNPMDLSQWSFFIISTNRLDKEIGDQKNIGLKRLKKVGAVEVKYKGIEKAVTEVVHR